MDSRGFVKSYVSTFARRSVLGAWEALLRSNMHAHAWRRLLTAGQKGSGRQHVIANLTRAVGDVALGLTRPGGSAEARSDPILQQGGKIMSFARKSRARDGAASGVYGEQCARKLESGFGRAAVVIGTGIWQTRAGRGQYRRAGGKALAVSRIVTSEEAVSTLVSKTQSANRQHDIVGVERRY